MFGRDGTVEHFPDDVGDRLCHQRQRVRTHPLGGGQRGLHHLCEHVQHLLRAAPELQGPEHLVQGQERSPDQLRDLEEQFKVNIYFILTLKKH